MTKQNYNAFASIIDDIGKTKPFENYSPAQPGDRVVGTASKLAQQIAAYVQKLSVELELATTRLQLSLDRIEYQNLTEEIFAIKQGLTAAAAMYELQIRGETKVWNARLTLRAGGQVVVTERDARMAESVIDQAYEAAQRGVEASTGGAPPRSSRMMALDLSQLADIFGEGGIDLFGGEDSPFANGDGRTHMT